MKRLIAWVRSRRAWRHCPHDNVAGIYGDAIIHAPGQRRNLCLDCGNTHLPGTCSMSCRMSWVHIGMPAGRSLIFKTEAEACADGIDRAPAEAEMSGT